PKKADNWKSISDEEPTEMTLWTSIGRTGFREWRTGGRVINPYPKHQQMDDGGTTLEGPSTASPLPSIAECDERCREIERKLNGVMELRWQRTEEDDVFRLDDDVDEEPGMEDELSGGIGTNWVTGERSGGGVGLRLRRSGCYLEKFVPIGNCTKHGFEESFGDEKLCTACQGIYVLNRECFPVFVNSVVCDRREFECIYDRLSGSAQGKCRPKVMRNRSVGADCEHWVYEYIEVPVACECYLSKRSVWLEAVPPSIGEEHLR
uniref:Beta-microseminoprotein n=1 Tax=Globodera pallida TaxID=36090 RepID=A0A183CRQ8_GLOPA